ncbi:MAG: hypothetical protein PHT40_02385 [Patescibacteria group bacterium]|nr:hypothetical protein [Patescibacteria group bacterium]
MKFLFWSYVNGILSYPNIATFLKKGGYDLVVEESLEQPISESEEEDQEEVRFYTLSEKLAKQLESVFSCERLNEADITRDYQVIVLLVKERCDNSILASRLGDQHEICLEP